MATLVTNFIARTEIFERGVTKSLGSLRHFTKGIANTQSQLINLAKGAVSLYAITKAFQGCITAAMEQERVNQQLAASLNVTGQAGKQAVKNLTNFASEMQKLTVFGDEEIISQMAYAKNLGVSTNQLKEAAVAAAGLSAKYRIDLPAAMMLVGRASQGQTESLKRYGIVLSSSLTSQEKFNALLGIGKDAFRLAMMETQTAEGAWKQMKNSLGDVSEEIGTALLPAVKSAAMSMKNWLENNQTSIRAWAEDFVEGTGIVISAMRKVTLYSGLSNSSTKIALEAQKRYREQSNDIKAFTPKYPKGLLTVTSGPDLAPPQNPELYLKIFRDVAEEAQKGTNFVADLEERLKSLNNAAGQGIIAPGVDGSAMERLTEGATKIREMLDALDFEYSLLGKINEERERSIELTKFQNMVAAEYVDDIQTQNELMKQYADKLDKIASGARGLAAFQVSIKKWVNDASNVWKNLGDAATGTLDRISDAFTDWIMTGKMDWQNFARQIIADLIRIQVRAAMAQTIGSVFSGIFGGGNIIAGVGHTGGIVGHFTRSRSVPALAFAGAPRLHSGLASDEFPAILQRGESVLPVGAKFGAPNIQVNVINSSRGQVNAKQQDVKWDGKKYIIDVLVEDFHKNGRTRSLFKGGV